MLIHAPVAIANMDPPVAIADMDPPVAIAKATISRMIVSCLPPAY